MGQSLLPELRRRGFAVKTLVRRPAVRPDEVAWDGQGELPREALAGIDAVVNLCGANIGQGRWTAERKRLLRESRLTATGALARAFGPTGPKILVNASAVGFYGSRGDEVLEEASGPGEGFLAGLCVDWEHAAIQARDAGARVACLRFGVVLGPGGALAQMLPAFRSGLGGRLGSGEQWMSWVALRDAVGALCHALLREDISGPVNVVSTHPIRNKDFTKKLCHEVSRWVGPPVPAFVLRALYGEMAQETLLASTRAVPSRLLASGFAFALPDVQDALAEALTGS